MLTATPSAGAVELSWTEVPGAVHYDLWTWWDAAIGWRYIGGDNLPVTTHTHTGLAAGTTYDYVVRGVDADGAAVSVWSEFASATPTSTTTPTDREALAALYRATDGAGCTNDTNWLSGKPLGEWYGVTTDANGRVTKLYITRNRLCGPIPPELGNLANLAILKLYENQLSGPIPPELDGLANLRFLSLVRNKLSGPIPPELGKLSHLKWVCLADNRLTGCIPAALRNVEHNDLNGLNLPFCN
ncbi:MAG: hypothetical protein OXI52_06340 [Caldilineaceae bacterium]|nr:hypothetical protein [Caldilineaceae bacterium]